MSKSRIYYVTISIALALYAVFAACWFYFFNRFHVLHYHEQVQLFRFDSLYACSYLEQPGGLAKYLGSFLTQFHFYPAAGAAIIACVLAVAYLLFYFACKSSGSIYRAFYIPFIPVTLLMISFADIHFDMSYALGILFALAGFKLYAAFRQPARFISGPILFAVIYFAAGGNALLFSALVVIFELFESKHKFKYPYLLALIAWSALLPWLAWRALYIVPIREAYFSLTSACYLFPTLPNKALWLSFPLLYLIWRLVASHIERWKVAPWKLVVANCLPAVVTIVFGIRLYDDRRAEILSRMAFEVQHDNWERVLQLGKSYPTRNRLACYFTNIALAESGQMPYRMFHYKQVGAAGLFLDWQLNYFSLWNTGEVYYRLGIIPEAEHCAFEALVSSPKEPNSQTLCRLVCTNIARRDSATAVKYLEFLEHSYAYRGWAEQKRRELASAMADSSFRIPGTPQPARINDFFINYQYPDRVLVELLKTNPQNRLAFEYLMAYYMLQKDIERVVRCMDIYFKNFGYAGVPEHYEEALIAYQNSGLAKSGIFAQYPVSQGARNRFAMYAQAFKAVQGNKRNIELLEKQFGSTYWYYLHFVEPATLQKKDEKNRY